VAGHAPSQQLSQISIDVHTGIEESVAIAVIRNGEGWRHRHVIVCRRSRLPTSLSGFVCAYEDNWWSSAGNYFGHAQG